MAEFVQKHIEQMLPELEQMERVGLFKVGETRKMLKKRRAFEYKLQRRTREKNDYIQYIQYEIKVLDLLKLRRQKTGYSYKKKDIDIRIVLRIHQLFRDVCERFPEDLELWMYRIQFAEKRNEKASITKFYTNMLKFHSRNPDLWVLAAKFEMEDMKNFDSARAMLQRGIRHNKESQMLWHEYFRFELLIAEWKIADREMRGKTSMEVDEDEDTSAAVLDGSVAYAVYSQSLDAFPENVEFIRGYFPICRLFKFTQKLERKLLEDLMSRYPNHELTWDARARAHLHPFNGGTESSRRKLCYDVFDEAVSKVSTVRLWDLYAECCLEQLTGSDVDQKVSDALSIFQRASDSDLLSEDMYLKWFEVLGKVGLTDDLSSALKKATQCYKSSCRVWLERLAWEQQSKSEDVEAMFDEAVESVPQKESVALWESQLQWSSLHHQSQDRIVALYERAVTTAGRHVAEVVKPMYLQWTSLNKSNKAVKKVYTKLGASKPLPLEFFKMFIKIQEAHAPEKVTVLRTAHEAAVAEYGTTHPDVWLAYIRMEQTAGAVDRVSHLHWRAQKTLSTEAAEAFTQLHTIQQQDEEQQ